jgi:hypothetical protein
MERDREFLEGVLDIVRELKFTVAVLEEELTERLAEPLPPRLSAVAQIAENVEAREKVT